MVSAGTPFLLVLALLPAVCYQAPPPTTTYTHSVTLKSDGMMLYWLIDGDSVIFEMHGHTTGWIGVGFSETGNMAGADIHVGWLKDGAGTITDRHGPTTGNGFPDKDTEQDLVFLSSQETDGWTIVKFSRELAACESTSDREITSSTMRVIWAYGTTDPSGGDIVTSDVHLTANRGVTSLYLLDATSPAVGCTLPTGVTYETLELKMDQFSVPASDTYYNCKLFKMPDVTNKKHIVKVEPVIQVGNEAYVHHIVVYQCGDTLADASALGPNARCYGSNMAHFDTCSSVINAWAIGGSDFCYPNNTGFSFGGGNGDPIYVQLEVHYNNPSQKSDISDSSGIRFTYTTAQTDHHDVGVLQVGNAVNAARHHIPPGAQSYLSVGFCAGDCLKNAMATDGISSVTVFAALLHAHLAGRALKLRHIRNGDELPYLQFDEYYDFNYQEVRMLQTTVEFKSGDILRLECEYNTEGRTQMTEGGLRTRNEMCLVYIWYYPRIDIGICETSAADTLYGFFAVETYEQNGGSLSSISITAPSSLAGSTLENVMNNFAWTEAQIDAYSDYHLAQTQEQKCKHRISSQTTEESFPTPGITTAYNQSSKACVAQRASGGSLGRHRTFGSWGVPILFSITLKNI